MKVIWPNDCPICHSVLVTFDGEHCICPSCAALEIERLRDDRLAVAERAALIMREQAAAIAAAEYKRWQRGSAKFISDEILAINPAIIARRAVVEQEKP